MGDKGTFQERLIRSLDDGDVLTIQQAEDSWELRIKRKNDEFGALQCTRYVLCEIATPGRLMDALESASEFLRGCVLAMSEAKAGQSDET